MYDWEQNIQTVTITIPLAYKVDPKKFESVVTENYVKLNIPELKILKFIDLYDTIDIDCSNIVLENNRILFYLKKVSETKWPTLEFKSKNKEELKERRKAAEDKLNKRIENERQLADNKKIEMGKFVIDKSITIDEERRKDLNEKKNFEKKQAENEINQFVEQIKKEVKLNQISNNQLDSGDKNKKIKSVHNINEWNHIYQNNIREEETLIQNTKNQSEDGKIVSRNIENKIFDEQQLKQRKCENKIIIYILLNI
jgi:hypothetical protein